MIVPQIYTYWNDYSKYIFRKLLASSLTLTNHEDSLHKPVRIS